MVIPIPWLNPCSRPRSPTTRRCWGGDRIRWALNPTNGKKLDPAIIREAYIDHQVSVLITSKVPSPLSDFVRVKSSFVIVEPSFA